MGLQSDQQRIAQLVSAYNPSNPPQLPLTFGDFLSILWRLDRSGGLAGREAYYRACAAAIACGLGFEGRSVFRLVQNTAAGDICPALPHAPYRGTSRLIDAQDRRAAIEQLVDLRDHIMSMGAYRDRWTVGWPGSRITDEELRERLFAVFFTAFDGQFSHFSRLVLVIDIVLQDMLLGDRVQREISLIRLIREFGYPDPDNSATRAHFGR